MNKEHESNLQQVKARLNQAAARLLTGDCSAADDADQATAEIRRIQNECDEQPAESVIVDRRPLTAAVMAEAQRVNDLLDLALADMGLITYFTHAQDPSKCVLQFSGGKDSLACLYLLRPHWDLLTVMWGNPGAAFPETIEQMARIRAMVPHFLEVKGNQPAHVELMGLPADMVPVRNTAVGKMFHPNDGVLLQQYWECCAASFWMPMQQAVVDLGATLIIRGQRKAEARRAPISNGHIENGIMTRFPIEDWTEQQVFDFLRRKGVSIPAHYAYTQTSLDCWTCTAYLDEHRGWMRYMREKHPELWEQYEPRLRKVQAAVLAELVHVDAALSVAKENRCVQAQIDSSTPTKTGEMTSQNRTETTR